ncbi:MAG: cupredoxin family copper-binding protein [Phyllobacteriaceae bacterium]|nr:cupredoxin family copper-binding protein [Phyllobacteriaceae bacterium]
MRLALTAAFVLVALPAFAADHAVEIKGMKFVPATLEVAVGDTITFANADGAPHTATADDGAFDTGRLNKGQSKQVTVAAAGDHAFKCLVHPMMKGTVTAK